MKVIVPGVMRLVRAVLPGPVTLKAIFDPTLGPLSGSIGGNVWSRNKGGFYVRLGSVPTNPQTSRQQTTRAQLGQMASGWTGVLTQDQRDAWDIYASQHPVINSLGKEVYITGLAWYCKCNTRLQDSGATLIADPPTAGAPSGLTSMAIDVSAATTMDVTFAATPLGTDERLQGWVSMPVSAGSTPNIRQCRLVGYSAAAQASPWAATLPHGFQSGDRAVAYVAVMSGEGLMSAYRQDIDDSDFV